MATTPDPDSFGGWIPIPMRGLGVSARQIYHWRRVGLLRPVNESPGSGNPAGWTVDDRRDVLAARGFYRVVAGGHSARWTATYATVLDRWRELGRPDGVYLGTVDGHPALWASEQDVLHDLAQGVALVAIPAPTREEAA